MKEVPDIKLQIPPPTRLEVQNISEYLIPMEIHDTIR